MFNWINKVIKRGPPKEPTPYLWGVIAGPFLSEDLPEEDEAPEGMVMLVMKVSQGTKVFEAEFWFDHMDDAYKLVQHFNTSIAPIELNTQEFAYVQ